MAEAPFQRVPSHPGFLLTTAGFPGQADTVRFGQPDLALVRGPGGVAGHLSTGGPHQMEGGDGYGHSGQVVAVVQQRLLADILVPEPALAHLLQQGPEGMPGLDLEGLPVEVAQAQGAAVQGAGIRVQELQGAGQGPPQGRDILGTHHQHGVRAGQHDHRIPVQVQAAQHPWQKQAAPIQAVLPGGAVAPRSQAPEPLFPAPAHQVAAGLLQQRIEVGVPAL